MFRILIVKHILAGGCSGCGVIRLLVSCVFAFTFAICLEKNVVWIKLQQAVTKIFLSDAVKHT